jgi:hypothetical protein
MFFSLINALSKIERKKLEFFNVVQIFTELGKDLTHLAHKENTQSEIFLRTG